MKQHNSGFLSMVSDAKSRIQELDIATVKNMQDQGEDFTLIDVREDSEWQQGFLPGAIHLSKGIIERDIEKMIPNHNQKLVLYCGGGFRSALAADSIQKMGYKAVWSMDGGFSAWSQAGFLVVKHPK